MREKWPFRTLAAATEEIERRRVESVKMVVLTSFLATKKSSPVLYISFIELTRQDCGMFISRLKAPVAMVPQQKKAAWHQLLSRVTSVTVIVTRSEMSKSFIVIAQRTRLQQKGTYIYLSTKESCPCFPPFRSVPPFKQLF